MDRHKHCRYSHQYLGGPIEDTLQPLCGAAFRATHPFALARCLIQLFSSIGLFIFPRDANESVYTDGDGTGNNSDTDDDGDGQLDEDELECGSDGLNAESMSSDADGDGVPDCADDDVVTDFPVRRIKMAGLEGIFSVQTWVTSPLRISEIHLLAMAVFHQLRWLRAMQFTRVKMGGSTADARRLLVTRLIWEALGSIMSSRLFA